MPVFRRCRERILLSSARGYSAQFIDPQSMKDYSQEVVKKAFATSTVETTHIHWGQSLCALVPELPLPTEGLRWAAIL